jgi:HlyD family secretion protein
MITLSFQTGCNFSEKKADAFGNFEAKEILISAEMNGKIVEKKFERGQNVTQNTVLCMQDTTELELQKRSINTTIKQLQTKLEIAESNKKLLEISIENNRKEQQRFKNLLNAESATKKQVDDLEFRSQQLKEQWKQAILSIQQIQTEKEQLQINKEQVEYALSKSIISSPITGTILDDYFEAGEIATFKSPLYKIANTETMILSAYFDGIQINNINVGDIVNVAIDKSKNELKYYEGKIIRIAEKSEFSPKNIQTKEERTTRVYKVEIEVENDGFIHLGMPAEVHLTME